MPASLQAAAFDLPTSPSCCALLQVAAAWRRQKHSPANLHWVPSEDDPLCHPLHPIGAPPKITCLSLNDRGTSAIVPQDPPVWHSEAPIARPWQP
ncbi:hypothetical protein BST61_g10561 [Cercospora zeina]